MALNKIYGEMEKNKIKDKKYSMPIEDFIEEHKRLIKVLKEGSREELLAEAKEQCEEFKDVLEEFGIEDEEEDDD